MRSISLLTLAITSCIPKEVVGLTMPLNRECDWVHTRLGRAQQNCIEEYFDPFESKSWVDATNNEFHFVFTLLKFNPIGEKTGVYFKTDLLTWARLITIKVCGADASQVAQDFLGLKFYYGAIVLVLNPIYWVLKALSYAPKIGPFFKGLSRGFEQPFKIFQNLEKQLYDKCDKANTIVSNIFRIIDFLWYVQMASYIIDDLIIPASNMAICHSVNTKVKELIDDDNGDCSNRRLSQRRYLSPANSTETTRRLATKAKFKKAFDDRRAAFAVVKNAADVINSTITVFNDIVEPIEKVMDPIGDKLEDVADVFQDILDYMEDTGLGGLLEDMSEVLKYIQCALCDAIEKLIEDGINEILKAAGLGTIEDFVDELLDPVYDLLPVDIDIDLSAFDFLNISNAVQDVVEEVEEVIDEASELANLARSVFDPSVDAADALAEIDAGSDKKSYFVTSEDGQSVTFSCPNDFLPVVVSAQHTTYACTEDLSAFMRFPCDTNSCTVQYSNVVLCPDIEPAGFDRFGLVTPQILHSTYICFHKSTDPKDLGIINDLQQYELNTGIISSSFSGPMFPISNKRSRKINVNRWAQIQDPYCTLDRVIELDHWESKPVPEVQNDQKWYNRGIGTSDNKYYRDLGVWLFEIKTGNEFDPTDPSDPVFEEWKADDTTFVWSFDCCDGSKKFSCLPGFSDSDDCDFDEFCPNRDGCTTGNSCVAGPSRMWPGEADGCSNEAERKAEYDRRARIVDEYIEMYNTVVDGCDKYVIPSCRGSTRCYMSQCQRLEFDYACVFKPDFARQILSFAFTMSRNPNSPVKVATCGTGRKIRLVKAEIGRGFNSWDVTQYQNRKCDAQTCTIDPNFLAGKVGLADEPEPQTVRVETYCECPAGFEPEPLEDGTCVPCDDGAYRKEGMSRCLNCPEGTHSKNSSLTALDDCVPCEKGRYNSETGSIACELCPPGKYNPTEGAVSLDACLEVPLSRIAYEDRSGFKECDKGYGNYPDNREECFPCGQGHIRPLGEDICRPCDPGSYSRGPHGDECKLTNPGTYQALSGQAGFALAPEDHYVNISGSFDFFPCPDGTVTGRQGADSIDLCLPPPVVNYPDCGSFTSCDDLLSFLNLSDSVPGDGLCFGDPRWCVNTALCNFDGGDCCPETCVPAQLQIDDNETQEVKDFLQDYYEYSCHPSTFRCLAPRNLSLIDCDGRGAFDPVSDPFVNEACQPRSESWSNGICNPDQNYANCEYDGGDCCMSTCKFSSHKGSCSRSSLLDCRDPFAGIDKLAPVWHGLPEPTLNLRCEAIPDWAPVSVTDNDICFDAVVLTEEERPQVCEAWTYLRRWNSTDRGGNNITYEQTMNIAADDVPPVWHNFPPDVTRVFLNEASLHPDSTGWPQVTEECSMPVALTWQDKLVIDEMQCGGERYLERTWMALDNCGNMAKRMQRIDALVTESSVAFGEAWNLQFTTVGGDLSAKSPSILQGAVGSKRDVDLYSISVATGGCAQSAAPYSVVAGSDVDAKKSLLDEWDPRPIYYVDKVKVEKTYEYLTKQEAILDWTSLATSIRKKSQDLAHAALLGGLFDGSRKQVCEQVEMPCRNDASSEPALVGSTTGSVTRIAQNLTLSGSSSYLNIFEVSISDFLVDEKQCDDTNWEFDVPGTALLIVNVRGSARDTTHSSGLKSTYRYQFKPPILKMGALRAEQLLVNLPDIVDEKIKLEGEKNGATELPFSLLAPGLDLDLRYLVVKGQVAVQSLNAQRIHGICKGLWWGNAPCRDTNLKLDGGWSEWGECHSTEQNPLECRRERTCSSPNPAFGGKDCQGVKSETCICSGKGGKKGAKGKSNKQNIFSRSSKSKGGKKGCNGLLL